MALDRPFEVAVLNTIQAAAADIVFGSNIFQLNDGTDDLLSDDGIIGRDWRSFLATAYSAGVLSDKDYDFTAATLTANTAYSIRIAVASLTTANALDANPRVYKVNSGTAAPTAAQLRDLFITEINQDGGRKVDASTGGGNLLTLILRELDEGDFTTVVSDAGVTEAVSTAFVEPAGTPDIVEAVAPTFSSATAQYTTYDVTFRNYVRNGAISGGFTHQEVVTKVFADTLAANYAAFNTEILAVFGGTHTPVANYLGV